MTQSVFSISSDQHCHTWSQFSQIGSGGVNSRLRTILNELERQAAMLKAAGGERMYLGGDLLHVRGSVAPEVINPLIETVKRICESGVDIFCIAGNHDLSSKSSTKLGNAMQSLDEIDGFCAIVAPELIDGVMMIPWVESLDELRAVAIANANPAHDLILHAPLNGVIKGLPDHGIDPVEAAAWGYKRVFFGHYHSHQQPAPNVYSIGATTHQTWSDPGTLAGFLMVDDTTVTHHETAAPKFINVDGLKVPVAEVAGNFCRLRLKDAEPDEIKLLRQDLLDAGAAGIVDHSTKKREVTRGVSTPTNVTLEVSVANYVDKHLEAGKLSKKRIALEALDILREARTVGTE